MQLTSFAVFLAVTIVGVAAVPNGGYGAPPPPPPPKPAPPPSPPTINNQQAVSHSQGFLISKLLTDTLNRTPVAAALLTAVLQRTPLSLGVELLASKPRLSATLSASAATTLLSTTLLL